MKNQKYQNKLIICFKKHMCRYLRLVLGLLGCVGARRVGFGGWGVVLGLCGLVLGLRVGGVRLGCNGL